MRRMWIVGIAAFMLACGGGVDPRAQREADLEAELARREAKAAVERGALDALERAQVAAAAEAGDPIVAEPVAVEPAAVEPAPAVATGEWAGTLTSARGTRLVLSRTSGEAPPVGATGQLQKEVRQKLFGADITAWVVIADVEVTKATADSLTVEVREEQAVIVVDGEKVDHFVPQSKVKLEWSR